MKRGVVVNGVSGDGDANIWRDVDVGREGYAAWGGHLVDMSLLLMLMGACRRVVPGGRIRTYHALDS